MKGTRTLLSLAVGLALASSGAHAAFVCPSALQGKCIGF